LILEKPWAAGVISKRLVGSPAKMLRKQDFNGIWWNLIQERWSINLAPSESPEAIGARVMS
jgi:hypothetical protein